MVFEIFTVTTEMTQYLSQCTNTEWWERVFTEYQHYVYQKSDPRTANLIFVSSPWPPIFITIGYLYFCWNVKTLTENLPTFNLKFYLIVYNAFMVLLAAYMSAEFALSAYAAGYGVFCQPVDYSSTPSSVRVARVSWLYYFSKYFEYSETIVFALRKKYRQITLLHVYHHASMLVVSWLTVKYAPGGQAYIFGTINSFVHAVMYCYYGLSAFGPWMRKYLWWKKYITILQLSQFVILFFYCIRSIAMDCDYPKFICSVMVLYSITLFFLFMNFYLKAYSFNIKQKQVTETKKEN